MDYVKVMRVWNNGTADNPCTSYNGWFISKIYAIDVKEGYFLVYDNGDNSGFDIAEGFRWVNATETYTTLDGETASVVTLFDTKQEDKSNGN